MVLGDHDCETQWNYCENGGVCHDNTGNTGWVNPTCACKAPYAHSRCAERIQECVDKPCATGSICTTASCTTDNNFDCYTCTQAAGGSCPVGTGGRQCREPNVCRASSCLNGGTCTNPDNVPTSWKCTCPTGNATWFYAQPYCELTPVFDCNIPRYNCLNGGTCSSGGGTFFCDCVSSFEGTQCELPNFCQSNTCLNGGTCDVGASPVGGGACLCLPNYSGAHCELLPFCSSSPCQNGGTCNDGVQGVGTCSCTPGFRGAFCEVPYTPDGCATMLPCSNGGTCSCTNTVNCVNNRWRSNCNCQAKWGDCRCNTTVPVQCPDRTEDNPCMNGGTCNGQLAGGYQCSCREGFYGRICESYDNICSGNNPCQNNGKCRISYAYTGTPLPNRRPGRGYGYQVCDCPYPYHGERCELRADVENLCQSAGYDLGVTNPCQNGGNCTLRSHSGGYFTSPSALNGQRVQLPPTQCLCPNGTYGLNCETRTFPAWDLCIHNPTKCLNGGTCLDNGVGDYAFTTCACRCGWAGERCEYSAAQIDLATNTNPYARGGALMSFCHNNPCSNGECKEANNGQGFVCLCYPGWWGTYCNKEGKSAALLAAVPSALLSLAAVAVALVISRRA